MDRRQKIMTRGLPKTGLTISQQPEDDGYYEAGWWKGRTGANNLTRFIARTIGGDDIVLDRATGLVWAADGIKAGCKNQQTANWADAIDYAALLNFAGFSDWRLPNMNELLSLILLEVAPPLIDHTFFPNTVIASYWTSSYSAAGPILAQYVSFSSASMNRTTTDQVFYVRCVRGGL